MAGSATIAPDGMMVDAGIRMFVLGLYENPQDDADLKRVAEAGFNLVRSSASVEALDRLHTHGLRAWLNTGSRIDLSIQTEQRKQQLRALAESCGSHPALLVWEVPDEALWNVWYGTLQARSRERTELRTLIKALEDKKQAARLLQTQERANQHHARGEFKAWEDISDSIWRELGQEPRYAEARVSNASERAARMAAGMLAGYRMLRQLDPNHPVWMNHAPRNSVAQMAAFNEAADIVGCDIYPVPEWRTGHSDLGDRSLASVGAYTERMQAGAPEKPVWMVLQGFGWADLDKDPSEEEMRVKRRPTFAESRFMAYDAIVRGARGILYWGTHYIEKDSDLWNDLLKLVRELADLHPVLSAPDAAMDIRVTIAETWGSVDRGVRVLAKDVDGRVWLLVVNEWPEPLRYTLEGLGKLDGTVMRDAVATREAVVTNDSFSLPISGHGIQVLAPVD
jgi:hypothetical protein